MPAATRTVIVGNASYVPPRVVPNAEFLATRLLDTDGSPFAKSNEEIVAQLEAITGIRERRYVEDDQVASDIALAAGGAWTLYAPLAMTWLLLRVSGVALLEKTIGGRRPEYADYVRRTSAFLPRPPRDSGREGAK